MKRVLVVSDLHCGHVVGLTHPAYQWHPQFKHVQSQLWDFFSATVEKLQPIDVLLVGGDCIDGKGGKSGGTEIFLPDLNDQVTAAINCLKTVNPKHGVMVHGTPYHTATADGTDTESAVAKELGFRIEDHAWIDVDGVMFDLKHKVGGSAVPHGRHTAVAREHLWNVLWAEHDESPKAGIILRGHVHYHNYCGGPGWLGMTLPALQGPGSKYGARQCNGLVHFGLTHFDVHENGRYQWQSHLLTFKGQVSPHKF